MAAAVPTSRLRPSHRPVRPNAMYMRPARKSLLASSRPILPAPHYARPLPRAPTPRRQKATRWSSRGETAGRRAGRGLFLACLHQSGIEQDRVELRVIVLPALIGLLGVTRTDDEAGLLRPGLEFRILEGSDDIRLEKAQSIVRDALRAGNATPCSDDDIETLLAEGWDVGCHEMPRRCGDAENFQLTRFVLLDGVRYRHGRRVHLARHQCGDGRRVPGIGHARDLEVELLLIKRDGDEGRSAGLIVAVLDLAGICARAFDEVLERADPARSADLQRVRVFAEKGDRL